MTLEKPVLNYPKKLANSEKLCTSCMLEGNEGEVPSEPDTDIEDLVCSDHLPWFCT